MKTTMNLDDDILAKASAYTGIKQKTAVVHEALRRLVAQEAARRLASLGGAFPNAKMPPRRKWKKSA